MHEKPWVLHEPLQVLESADEPYLQSARGRIGAHELALHHAPETPDGLRVFLDGELVFEQGQATPGVAWYQLCRDLGYQPEDHWDLDPALILFHQALPALVRDWREHALPYDDLGLPEGVVCLATVAAAWEGAVAGLDRSDPGAQLAAACFQALPLRAVVFHDDPAPREDYVGTGVDEPLVGIFMQFGGSRESCVTLAKATVNGTGGLRWSPWEPGGDWAAEGREWAATQGPADFLAAAGLGEAPAGFAEAFQAALSALAGQMDPVVDGYRRAYPARIPWHRDTRTRFLNRMIVEVRSGARLMLVLDDGSEVEVVDARLRRD